MTAILFHGVLWMDMYHNILKLHMIMFTSILCYVESLLLMPSLYSIMHLVPPSLPNGKAIVVSQLWLSKPQTCHIFCLRHLKCKHQITLRLVQLPMREIVNRNDQNLVAGCVVLPIHDENVGVEIPNHDGSVCSK